LFQDVFTSSLERHKFMLGLKKIWEYAPQKPFYFVRHIFFNICSWILFCF
jgi:hypothetical protein